MQVKSFLWTAGLGLAAGAAAILMMPTQSPVRKAANKAAETIEDAVVKTTYNMMH